MHILAIDQGTTSSRAIVFDGQMQALATAQQEFPQHFPQSGWVEHDAMDLWSSVAATARAVIEKARLAPQDIAAIGITNQRETTLLWDRRTGQPLHRAIVWQDRRTADLCHALKPHEAMITARTGLLLDPYFSGTKLAWLLDHVEGARVAAKAGHLAFGTVDSWLIWNLTGGKVHATDATNAARTLLYDIDKGVWDPEICALLDIPISLLPEVRDCAADYGMTRPDLFGRPLPIFGVAGDQQAATIGQACFTPGMMKATYGTGCFALLNTGAHRLHSSHRLLSTIAYRLQGRTTYALEGSIFIAGAVVQWLRDGLQMIRDPAETQTLAEAADPSQSVLMVPAFTGLGAPWWAPECRGAIFGLTRNTRPPELARAALQSIGFQTRDLWQAMQSDWQAQTHAARQTVLRVDGGVARNDWTMQFLADILGAPVDRPHGTESTALGAAWLAGHHAGLYGSQTDFAKSWALQRRFTPQMATQTRDQAYARWTKAVQACLSV